VARIDPMLKSPALACRAMACAAIVAAWGTAAAPAQSPALEALSIGAPGILGRQGNRDAVLGNQAISADGRWVVYRTRANNLDPNDRDANTDVYLAAADGSSTQRISATPPGAPAHTPGIPSISPDGLWVAWAESQGAEPDTQTALLLHERATARTTTVAASGLNSFAAFGGISVSNNAARLSFRSEARLVADDLDDQPDVHVWTRADGSFRRVNRNADGSSIGRVSGDVPITPDGRHVAFFTQQFSTIPDSISAIHVVDLITGARDEIRAPDGARLEANFGLGLDLSVDARWLALASPNVLTPTDINGRDDVYVFDRLTRTFELASVTSAGAQVNCDSQWPSIAGDGSAVAFSSCGSGFQVSSGTISAAYLRLRAEGRTLLLGRPLDGGTNFGTRFQVPVPAISADGSRVAFASESEHLVEGDSNRRTDAFVFDSASVTLRRVGLATGAALPAGASGIGWRPDTLETVFASRGGEHALFSVEADNLLLSRTAGALRIDTRRRVISDALPGLALPGPPGATEVAEGISDDGSVVLVRRVALPSEWGVPPDPDVPRDLWLFGSPWGLLRVDGDPALGPRHQVEAAAIAGNGRRVAFLSRPISTPTLRGVYQFDADTGTTLRIDRLPSGAPPLTGAEPALALSRNGRWLVFASSADGLVAGDDDRRTDLFLADLTQGSLRRLVNPASGSPLLGGPDAWLEMAVSDDGERITFLSRRTDLAPGGAAYSRLFLLDLARNRLLLLSRANAAGYEDAASPSISADGRRVAFVQFPGLRVLELGPDGDIVGEPTESLPAIPTRHASISPDGYSVALSSGADFHWLPTWLAADGNAVFLLRLPAVALFTDGFEPE
jgi:Tol biopolymer transport system component